MEKLTKEQIDNLPEWMSVRDFEGFYEVNCRAGLVRNSGTLKVLKPSLDTHGYPLVVLSKDGRHYTKKVHRIVALTAFGYYNIPTDGFDVCHLDEERWDARIFNLSLGSHQENMNFEQYKQRRSEAQKGKHHCEETRLKMSESRKGKCHSEEHRKKMVESVRRKLCKRVGAYENGELIMTFQSTQEAGRNGFNQGLVSACCIGRRRVHKGYVWKYIK